MSGNPGFVTISTLSVLENAQRPDDSKSKLWAFDTHLNFVDDQYAQGIPGAGALAYLCFFNSGSLASDPNVLTPFFIVARVC